jgi:hypothetical protein
LTDLLNKIVPNELRAPMPPGMSTDAQIKAKQQYFDYVDRQSGSGEADGTPVHAFGRSF